MILPTIMADLTNKVSEFTKNLVSLTIDFETKIHNELDNIKKSTFENDEAFKYEFMNIHLMNPAKFRATR